MDQQIVVYPNSGIKRNKLFATWVNLKTTLENNSPDERVCVYVATYVKVEDKSLVYSDSSSGQLGSRLGTVRKRSVREHKEVLGVINMFPLVVIVLWGYTYVKTYQMVHFRYV